MLFYGLWTREPPKAPKTIEAVAAALACPSELDSKTGLLKTTPILNTRHREMAPELSWKLPPAG